MWLSIGLNLGSLRKLSVNNYRHAYEEEKVAVEEGFMKKLERKVIELLKRKESVVDDKALSMDEAINVWHGPD